MENVDEMIQTVELKNTIALPKVKIPEELAIC